MQVDPTLKCWVCGMAKFGKLHGLHRHINAHALKTRQPIPVRRKTWRHQPLEGRSDDDMQVDEIDLDGRYASDRGIGEVIAGTNPTGLKKAFDAVMLTIRQGSKPDRWKDPATLITVSAANSDDEWEDDLLPHQETIAVTTTPSSIRPPPSERSVPATTNIQRYNVVTKRAAGTKFEPRDEDWASAWDRRQPILDKDMQDPQYWEPFANCQEYDLATWFLQHRISKGAIDDYLKKKKLGMDGINFRNAEDVFRAAHKIPYGIRGDDWKTVEFSGTPNYEGEPTVKYTVYYRDVMKVIQFLIGYRPFEQHLSYAPIRQTSASGLRVYNEMHTADWWWRLQDELPEHATVVPLIIASDKTILTQHHGDKAAWPVYLTIGNLNHQIRRTPSLPAMILLGFIPLCRNGEDRVLKGELYHTALKYMLERMISAPL
jgi:Plavaka transposase